MSREFSKNTLRFALAAVTIFETVTHLPDSTQNALRSLTSPDPSCAEIAPSFGNYDAIAVFGAGLYKDQTGIEYPNTYQLERLKAAAAAYANGFSNQIILIDNGDGEVLTNSYYFLSENVNKLSGGAKSLLPENVKIITGSVNSAENTEDLKQFMSDHGLTKVLSISDMFHYKRLRLLLDNYGVNSVVDPTECIANDFIKEDVSMLMERQNTPRMAKMQNKEWWAILELSLDAKGKLSIAYKKSLQFLRGQ